MSPTIKSFTDEQSSQIREIEYHPESKELFISFKTKDPAIVSKYIYDDVPKEVFDMALEAESIGKFFYANIKGKYEYLKLDPEKS
jgi:hypothetical protein